MTTYTKAEYTALIQCEGLGAGYIRGFAIGSHRDGRTPDIDVREGASRAEILDALNDAASEGAAYGDRFVTEMNAIGEASTDRAIRMLQALLDNDRSAVMEALWDEFSEDACEAIADRLIDDEGVLDAEVGKAMNAAIEAVQRALTAAWDGCVEAGRVVEIVADGKEEGR